MTGLRATQLAHAMISAVVKPGDTVCDATAGNGHDTAFLAACVGESGQVYAFDVQPLALARARRRVEDLRHVTWIEAGHERLAEHLPADTVLAAAMFNLGYLPGGDKRLATTASTTLAAVDAALTRLRVGGRITLVLYTGHPGGADEAAAVKAAVSGLPAQFASGVWTRLGTQTAAPELVVVDRIS